MKKQFRFCSILFIRLFGCVIVGYALLVLVYTIPVSRMRIHVENVLSYFGESDYPQVFTGYKGSQLELYSDGLMISKAIYKGNESFLEKAAAAYSYRDRTEKTSTAYAFVSGTLNQTGEIHMYGRYWHGYLVLLKPLLLLLSYTDIRLLNYFLQSMLLFLSIILTYKKKGARLSFCLFLTYCFFMLPCMALSIYYSCNYYLLLVSTLILLSRDKEPKFFFFYIGAISCYVDILGFPIVTLGIPLLLCLELYEGAWYENVKKVIYHSSLWGFGYVGMWIGKWIIAAIFTPYNIFENVYTAASFRLSSADAYGNAINLVDVIKAQFSIFEYQFFAVVACIIISLFLITLWKICRFKREQIVRLAQSSAAYFLVALLPFGWYFILKNHSYIHNWITYRDLAVTLWAGLIVVCKIYEKDQIKIVPIKKDRRI